MQKVFTHLYILSLLSHVVSTQVATRNAGNVRHYWGEWTACAAADGADISTRPLLRTADARSQMDCLRQCYRLRQCEALVYDSSSLCHQLGPSGQVNVNNVILQGSGCHTVYLNPCYNGAPFVNGMCQCSKSYTGLHCELINDERCNYPFKMIHGFDGGSSVNGFDDLVQISNPNFKIAFVKDASSFSVVGPADHRKVRPSTGTWVAQVHNTISKISLSTYAVTPHTERFVMKHTGRLQGAPTDFNGSLFSNIETVDVLRMSVFARFPTSDYVVEEASVDDTVDDVIRAIQRGYEPLGAPAITFDESRKLAIQHRPGIHLATDENGKILKTAYIYYSKNDASSNRVSLKQFFNGNRAFSSASTTKNFVFDLCWFDATVDIRNPETNKTAEFLKAALQNGKRARVVFDGISAKVKATYIFNDHVLFQISPYLTPRDTSTMDESTALLHSIVHTDGRVKTCSHKIWDSAAIEQSSYVADDVKWFVDSRVWELLYETEMDGTFVSGDLKELKEKITSGVDVQIVVETLEVTYSFPGQWMTTDPWQQTNHHVSAEIKDLLTLDVSVDTHDFEFFNSELCTRSNILISSDMGWQQIDVNYGPASDFYTHGFGNTGKIRWFVSGHD